MSLLDKDMLPDIRRAVPQLYDTLQTEDKYIEVILKFVDWLTARMVLLRSDVMTPENLREKIRQITGLECDIIEDAEHLTITLRYHEDTEVPYIPKEKEVLAYVPAHLKVITSFLQKYAGTCRVNAGPALARTVRYIAKPMTQNKQTVRSISLVPGNSLFIHSRVTAYPKMKGDQ